MSVKPKTIIKVSDKMFIFKGDYSYEQLKKEQNKYDKYIQQVFRLKNGFRFYTSLKPKTYYEGSKVKIRTAFNLFFQELEKKSILSPKKEVRMIKTEDYEYLKNKYMK